MTISKLYWASVGGQKTEPIRVAEENGKTVFYSIGCNDPRFDDAAVDFTLVQLASAHWERHIAKSPESESWLRPKIMVARTIGRRLAPRLGAEQNWCRVRPSTDRPAALVRLELDKGLETMWL